MPSRLIITSAGNLQRRVISTIKSLKSKPIVFVSLNKPRRVVERTLKSCGLGAKNIYFIDCIDEKEDLARCLHIAPDRLDLVESAVKTYSKSLNNPVVVVDSLSTFMIYNAENKVAQFAKRLTDFASEKEVSVIALSPKTGDEDFLNKIYNFFDEVVYK